MAFVMELVLSCMQGMEVHFQSAMLRNIPWEWERRRLGSSSNLPDVSNDIFRPPRAIH